MDKYKTKKEEIFPCPCRWACEPLKGSSTLGDMLDSYMVFVCFPCDQKNAIVTGLQKRVRKSYLVSH